MLSFGLPAPSRQIVWFIRRIEFVLSAEEQLDSLHVNELSCVFGTLVTANVAVNPYKTLRQWTIMERYNDGFGGFWWVVCGQ